MGSDASAGYRMIADPLLTAIRAVPMRCADCVGMNNKMSCSKDRGGSLSFSPGHTWETDDAGIARAVRAFVWERVTVEALAGIIQPHLRRTESGTQHEYARYVTAAVLALMRQELGDA